MYKLGLLACVVIILQGAFAQEGEELEGVQSFHCGLDGICIYGECHTLKCADSDCYVRRSNIQGDIVLLDVNSRHQHEAPKRPPKVTNPAECCDQCKHTLGCNAWAFCNKKQGCGTYCKDYVDSLDDPTDGFGPFGGCDGEAWPWLNCQLKTVSNTSEPREIVGDDGWVSGVVNTSAKCPESEPFVICNACELSPDPQFCHNCVRNVTLRDQFLCATCATLPTSELKNYCQDCLSSEYGSLEGCGICAAFNEKKAKECFKCSFDESELQAQGGCVSCQQSAMNVQECVDGCVKWDEISLIVKPECGSCYAHTNETLRDRCVQCLQSSSSFDTECNKCTTEDCFECLATFPMDYIDRLACSNCPTLLLKNYTALSQCLNCVTNPKVPENSKEQCGYCSLHGNTTEQREACFSCLESSVENGELYNGGQACPNCLRTGKDPDRCYECVEKMFKRGARGQECWGCAQLDTDEERAACYECTEDEDLPVDIASTCNMCFIGENDYTNCTECYKTTTFEDRLACW